MLQPRTCILVSAAAATAAFAGLLGRIELSVPAVLLLLIAARSAALLATVEPAGVRLSASWAATVPAWILIAAAGIVRANSVSLADVRGAHAVAGPGLTHGEPLLVVACWLGLLGGIMALAASVPARRMWVGGAPALQAELLSGLGLVILLVTLFLGPQVVEPIDALPWVAAAALITGAVLLCSRMNIWAVRASTVLAAAAAVLALVGR